MNAGAGSRASRLAVLGPLVLAVVSVGLGWTARVGIGDGIAVALGGVTVGIGIGRLPVSYARLLALVPPLVALGILAAWAPDDLGTELLGGLGGLALLFSLLDGSDTPIAWGEATAALAVPGLAVVVAMLTRAAVPLGTANLGEAALVLVVLLLGGAYLYRDPAWLSSPTS